MRLVNLTILSSPYLCRPSAGTRMTFWAVPWKYALLMSWCLNFNGFPLFDKLTDTFNCHHIQEKCLVLGLQPLQIHSIDIVFELFTKILRNRCHQLWRIRVQQQGLHLRTHPSSFPSFFPFLVKRSSPSHLDSPTVCEETFFRT